MEEKDTGQGIKVLVVDDDPSIVKVIRLLLKSRGFEICEALNGASCLETAANEHPDIILLDIMMPDIDGYEVCRHLKANESTADIPVVFVTAKTSEEDMQHGLELGAKAYIKKPFSPRDLAQKINEVLGRE